MSINADVINTGGFTATFGRTLDIVDLIRWILRFSFDVRLLRLLVESRCGRIGVGVGERRRGSRKFRSWGPAGHIHFQIRRPRRLHVNFRRLGRFLLFDASG